MITRDYRSELIENRCSECGTFWAIESGKYGECPRCKMSKINTLRHELEVVNRSNASLRGVIKRMHNKVTP